MRHAPHKRRVSSQSVPHTTSILTQCSTGNHMGFPLKLARRILHHLSRETQATLGYLFRVAASVISRHPISALTVMNTGLRPLDL